MKGNGIYVSMGVGSGVILAQEERQDEGDELLIGVTVIEEGVVTTAMLDRDEIEELIAALSEWLKDTLIEEITGGSRNGE